MAEAARGLAENPAPQDAPGGRAARQDRPQDRPQDRKGAPKAVLPADPPPRPARAPVQDAAPKAPLGPPPGFIRQFELVDRVKAYDPQADEALLNRAYVYAMRAHGDQTRSSGDPYFTHPLSVAAILTELKLDPATIATALLHDVVEDTEVTTADIAGAFGEEVAGLVDGVTKISERELSADADGKAESFAKFILATAKDVRVLLVKLADRLHNMRTLSYVPEAKRERIARETMEIYAPLAGRIGVQRIKEELEDLSFRYLNPQAFDAITTELATMREHAVSGVVALAQTIRARLAEAGIEAEVHSREKRAFSVWRKMQRKESLFEELADIYAFRVIVPDTADCYRALGVIHTSFPMIPGEFDDYVSSPKANNYRSIHTAVLTTGRDGGVAEGTRVEVQIRSKRMHETAERGIAAHWRYKDASARQETGQTVEMQQDGRYDAYEWLRGAVRGLAEGGDPAEFLAQAKMDLYRDQVFPFTPRGRVIPLPQGAVGLDFAYALHTDIGDGYAGVRINGVHRPDRTPLRSGDVVEILRADDAPIPPGWEAMVATGTAKTGLRRRTRALAKREQHKLGRRIVTAAFAARSLPFSEDAVRDAAKGLGYRGLKPLLEAAGRLEVSGARVIEAVFPDLETRDPGEALDGAVAPGSPQTAGRVSLEGLDRGAQVRLARCCSPLPGESIVGVPGGEGQVAVHRTACEAVAGAPGERLPLEWSSKRSSAFVAPIVVTVNNRTGAIGHIGSMLARYEADIVDMELQHREVAFSDLCLDISVRDARHLSGVLTGLRASDYVVEARRRDTGECG